MLNITTTLVLNLLWDPTDNIHTRDMENYLDNISVTNCKGDNFVKNWPWAALNLMNQHKSLTPLLKIADNPNLILPTVSKMLCCSGLEDCKKAQYFAKEMPRYAECDAISELLGNADNKQDMWLRSILLDVNYEEKGELFQRIANAPRFSEEHLSYVANSVNNLQSSTVKFLMSKLIVAVLAGTETNLRDMHNFRNFYKGLEIVSLACFSLNYQAQCKTFSPSYNYEFHAGIFSILKMLYTNKPVPTPYQLSRFAKHVEDNVFSHRYFRRSRHSRGNILSLCHYRVIQMDIKNLTWPAPPGWESEMGLQGQITPLNSAESVLKEGKENKNCLESDIVYTMDAACGDIALFSLRLKDMRATLMLNMRKRSNKQMKFRIAELKGPCNAKPTSEIKKLSDNLVTQLNSCQSQLLPNDNYPLQNDHWESLIIPNGNSQDLWKLFSSVLPKRFQSYGKLISHYTDALHTVKDDYDKNIYELREIENKRCSE